MSWRRRAKSERGGGVSIAALHMVRRRCLSEQEWCTRCTLRRLISIMIPGILFHIWRPCVHRAMLVMTGRGTSGNAGSNSKTCDIACGSKPTWMGCAKRALETIRLVVAMSYDRSTQFLKGTNTHENASVVTVGGSRRNFLT